MVNKQASQNPELCQSFIRQATEVLSKYPHIKHQWSIDADEACCTLQIPEQDKDGFPVTVEINHTEVTIIAGDAHTNFNFAGDSDEITSRILGLVRDLLSPAMRIREYLAGGKSYKWAFELNRDGKWKTEEWSGLLFWNYFGKRTEKVYQNKILPARENPVDSE